jgi:hypothetical protein
MKTQLSIAAFARWPLDSNCRLDRPRWTLFSGACERRILAISPFDRF